MLDGLTSLNVASWFTYHTGLGMQFPTGYPGCPGGGGWLLSNSNFKESKMTDVQIAAKSCCCLLAQNTCWIGV